MSAKNKKLKIVFLGPPSSGKGTQAEMLAKKLSLPHISSGDIFREQIKKGTGLGRLAASLINKGRLVPDKIVNRLIIAKLKTIKGGFVLDGYPRNLNQAKALAQAIKVDLVLEVKISDSEVIHRLSGRRVCPRCHQVYHLIHKKPKKQGICDKCGADLIQRKDDYLGAIKVRLKIYHQVLNPIINFYQKKGLLEKINGQQEIKKVSQDIMKTIKNLKMEKKPFNLVILGPPGSGKGTQSNLMQKKFNLKHLELGDTLREIARKRGVLAKKIEKIMLAGKLVPTKIILRILQKQIKGLKNQGILLDGFPRDLVQVRALEKFMKQIKRKIDFVFFLKVDKAEIVERLAKRKTCLKCDQSFIVGVNISQNEKKCPICQGKLYRREDDTKIGINKRWQIFEKQTRPLLNYFSQKKMLTKINGQQPIKKVFQDILKTIYQ